jgi:8-oxo-dGTP pyrophosphatase MutT (NUDIX family)
MQKLDWDAAVVLLQRRDGKVLGVTRGHDLNDINPPGGYREPWDQSPLDTARRELYEETGIRLHEAVGIASWFKDGRYVIAFKGINWSGALRPSKEGVPAWVRPNKLFQDTCTYRGFSMGMLQRRRGRGR